jgi:hypothetical protein
MWCCLVCREDQFHKLIDVLGEESPFNAQGWHLQYKTYYGAHPHRHAHSFSSYLGICC